MKLARRLLQFPVPKSVLPFVPRNHPLIVRKCSSAASLQSAPEIEEAWRKCVIDGIPDGISVRTKIVGPTYYELDDVLSEFTSAANPALSEEAMEKATKDVEELIEIAYTNVGPSKLTLEHFEEFMKLPPSTLQRRNYLKFLFKKQMMRESARNKRATKDGDSPESLEVKEPRKDDTYMRSWFKSWNKYKKDVAACHQAVGLRLGNPIIFDLSFEHLMNTKELTGLIKQVVLLHSFQKNEKEPYHLYFTSLSKSSRLHRTLREKYCFGEDLESFLATTTSHHFIDIFPKERLVYLSPDSPNTLTSFDPDDIFIIGGLSDLTPKRNATLDAAMRAGIRHANLPIKNCPMVQVPKVELTLTGVYTILNEFARCGDMMQAIYRGTPSRHRLTHQQAEENVRRRMDRAKKLVAAHGVVEKRTAFLRRQLRTVQQT